MADVLCLGEILVDWVSTTVGAELDTAQTFTKAAVGAPANTAVGLARQGVKVGFIGRVSDDEFGSWLRGVLENDGIDTSGTVSDKDAQTRMAYVVTTSTGDRKLAEFTKVACADARLQASDLIADQFAKASILHFGSISMIDDPSKDATRAAVELGKKNNVLISYDPNVRLGLWSSPQVCRQAILDTLSWGDVIKINEDELEFLTGKRALSSADKLRAEHNIPLLIITLDARGSYICTSHGSKQVPGFKVKLVEATGAGDGFNAGVLEGLLPHIRNEKNRREALQKINLETLTDIFRRANAIGAIACTRAGAIPALPTKTELDSFLNSAATAATST